MCLIYKVCRHITILLILYAMYVTMYACTLRLQDTHELILYALNFFSFDKPAYSPLCYLVLLAIHKTLLKHLLLTNEAANRHPMSDIPYSHFCVIYVLHLHGQDSDCIASVTFMIWKWHWWCCVFSLSAVVSKHRHETVQ